MNQPGWPSDLCASRDLRADDRTKARGMEKEALPAVFRAAGLMVPDPSIMSLPMPFSDVDTGCEVEYMARGLLE